MKSYIKGIITGFAAGLALTFTFAMADNIEVALNRVRLNINGVDTVQWGENITSGGEETPSSILYNGTTYLPMRKLGELNGNKIYWNGDSRTAYMTGAQTDIKVIAEKSDKNGNMWKYYTFKDSSGNCYLGVKDEGRGYERVYRLACKTMNITDNEIYFLRQSEEWEINTGDYPKADLVKLSFYNDENTQDGEIIHTYALLNSMLDSVLIDKDYIFMSGDTPSTMSYGFMAEFNYLNGADKYSDSYIDDKHWTSIRNLHVIESDNEYVVIGYDLYDNGGGWTDYEITFDKTTNKFSKPKAGKRKTKGATQ